MWNYENRRSPAHTHAHTHTRRQTGHFTASVIISQCLTMCQKSPDSSPFYLSYGGQVNTCCPSSHIPPPTHLHVQTNTLPQPAWSPQIDEQLAALVAINQHREWVFHSDDHTVFVTVPELRQWCCFFFCFFFKPLERLVRVQYYCWPPAGAGNRKLWFLLGSEISRIHGVELQNQIGFLVDWMVNVQQDNSWKLNDSDDARLNSHNLWWGVVVMKLYCR